MKITPPPAARTFMWRRVGRRYCPRVTMPTPTPRRSVSSCRTCPNIPHYRGSSQQHDRSRRVI